MCVFVICFKCNWFSPHRESLEVVNKYFVRYAIQDQDILGCNETVEKVLALVPEDILFHVSHRKHWWIGLKVKKNVEMLFLLSPWPPTNNDWFLHSCYLLEKVLTLTGAYMWKRNFNRISRMKKNQRAVGNQFWTTLKGNRCVTQLEMLKETVGSCLPKQIWGKCELLNL